MKKLYDVIVTGLGMDYLTLEREDETVAIEFKLPWPNEFTPNLKLGDKIVVGIQTEGKEGIVIGPSKKVAK